MIAKEKKRLSMNLDLEVYNKIKSHALKNGRTIHGTICFILKRFFENGNPS